MSDSETAGSGRGALVMTLVAPLVLVLVLGTAFGEFTLPEREAGGIAEGPLLKAPAGADEVPADRIVEKVPRNCGVSEDTAARLAPGGDIDAEAGGLFRDGGPGSCKWYSLDDGKATCDFCLGDFANERVLDVEINLAKGTRQSPVTAAMELLSGGGQGAADEPGAPRIVDGLGEEAVARYSAATDLEGASVAFRVGNAVVTVRYRGWDDAGGERRTIPEGVALDGAFAAAAETAKAMGTAAGPVVRTVERPAVPPLRKVPKPCDTVSGATVEKVARGAYRRRAEPFLVARPVQSGMSFDGCAWHAATGRFVNQGEARTLTVSLAVAEERTPGSAVPVATRHYLGLHRNQRYGKAPGSGAFSGFEPLAGPGDRAFAVTMAGRGGSRGDAGLVVFQKRNVVVEVAYDGRDGDTKLRGRELIDSAYTVAVEVERALEL
ncbi:hypothetical protein [Actinomadura sp. WMMB 499]|uniref:hypothetical protein n=1 Tax=Actinomadura sp. WMMB 499 TaxID=1219491 RepID=UPI0012458432|nr:hypothetical protein [Actinomadura sp. WMMB 499]QFG23545.1 hypothetical protein F7P10_22915 [Actinomadura sp. WMMB 499]